jgi:hypothetical protein
MFVRDITDISWEIFRHGGDRECVLSFKTALRAVLTDVLPEEGCKPWFDRYDTVKGLAQAWFEGPQEQEKVESELAKYGLTAEAIVAQTYALRPTSWTSCIVCLPSPRQGASRLFAISMSIGPCPHWGKSQLSKANRLRSLRKVSERTVRGLCRRIGSFVPTISRAERNYFRHAGYGSI